MNDSNNDYEFAITTIDNPYDPFDEFTEWFQFDVDNGYSTCSKIARLSEVKDYMPNEVKINEVELIIDRLIEIDPLNMYKKVIRKRKNTGEGV